MIRILFITWLGEIGGAEIALLRLLEHLDRGKFLPEVWLFQDGPLAGEIKRRHIKLRIFNFKRFASLVLNIKWFIDTVLFLRREKINLIHANGTLAYLASYLPAKISSVPLVWWLVDMPVGTGWPERIAGRLPSSKIICNSKATSAAFKNYYPAQSSKCEIVYPGILLEAPTEDERIRVSRLIPRDAFCVLSMGRFQKWKGQEVLLRAIPAMLRIRKNMVFVFLGDEVLGMKDACKTELLNLARSLGIESYCCFPGFRKDVSAWLERADTVVHTSLSPEPFGMVIAEALLMSKAVVASASGGPLEIIQPGVTGLLIEPGNPEVLAAALLRLMDSPKLRQELGDKGRLDMLARFGADQSAVKMQRIYGELVP